MYLDLQGESNRSHGGLIMHGRRARARVHYYLRYVWPRHSLRQLSEGRSEIGSYDTTSVKTKSQATRDGERLSVAVAGAALGKIKEEETACIRETMLSAAGVRTTDEDTFNQMSL